MQDLVYGVLAAVLEDFLQPLHAVKLLLYHLVEC